jgi:hypothetical protein
MGAGPVQPDDVSRIDPEAVADVDVGRYVRVLGSHWWVVAAGFVFGATAGFAIALGHGQEYSATASVYLGLPYAASGNVPLQALQTNPSTIGQIVHSVAIDLRVARECKTPVSTFSGGVSTQQVAGGFLPNRQTPYATITVLAGKPGPGQCVADALARAAIVLLAPYARSKVAALQRTIGSDDRDIKQTDSALASRSRTTADKLLLLVQLRGLQSDRVAADQLLEQALRVELPRLLGGARAVRVSARTPRTSSFVAGLIGALVGAIGVVIFGYRRARRVEAI